MSGQRQTSAINSEQRTIGNLLGDKRFLRVPAYQRSFSWTKSEVSDLWDDLQGILYGEEDHYFLGSMVFISKSDGSLEVVDGQQRLATVSLLLAAIRDGFQSIDDRQRADHIDMQYLCTRDLKTMEAAPRLSLNEIDNGLFMQLIEKSVALAELKVIQRNKDAVLSNRLLARAYVLLHENVWKASDNFKNTEFLSSVVGALTDSISCIQIITASEDSAYVLFETLNDRGIDLTLSDMLKNFLFSKAGKRLEETKHKWTETVTLIGQEYMKTYIRHEWMSRHGQTREKALYKKIKAQIRTNPKAFEYIALLRKSARVYDAIRNPDHALWTKFGPACQSLLEEILILGPVQCYPLILSAYFARQRDLVKVLSWIVALTVRYSIICAKGTGNLETAYARASSRMRQPEVKIKSVKEILGGICPSDDEFVTTFKEKTLSSPRIIKYLLAKIEMSITGDDSLIPNPDVLTVEHILPKSPSSKWPLAIRKKEFLERNCGRIGNLTILTGPMNRDCENSPFSDKKKEYKTSKYKLTTELDKFKDWTAKEIDDRQELLAQRAKNVWALF